MLIEGVPSALDANGSPLAFSFGNPQVLVDLSGSGGRWGGLTPLVSDLKYSDAGDAYVAYGFTTNTFTPLYDANHVQMHPSLMTTTSEVGCLLRAVSTSATTRSWSSPLGTRVRNRSHDFTAPA